MENKLKGGYDEEDSEFDNEEACENNIEDFISIVYVRFSPRMKMGYYFRMFHNERECKNDWSVGINQGKKNISYGNFMGPITFKNEEEEKEKAMISHNLFNVNAILSGDTSSEKIKTAAYDMYDFYKDKDLKNRKFPITYTQYKNEVSTPTETVKDAAFIEYYTGFKTCKLDPKRPGYCAKNNPAADAAVGAGGRRKKSVRKSSRRARKSRKKRKSTRRVRS